MAGDEERRRRKVLMSAAVLGAVALGIYFAFIFLAGGRG